MNHDWNTSKIVMRIGSQTVMSYTVPNTISNAHLYVAWDKSGGLEGGNTIAVYLDGQKRLWTNRTDWDTDASVFRMIMAIEAYADETTSPYNEGGWNFMGIVAADNLQIWNHVITEDLNIVDDMYRGEYENMLHPIYGEANGYRPKLDGGSGVGYQYLP